MKLQDIKISVKLMVAFVSIIITLVAVSATVMLNLSTVYERSAATVRSNEAINAVDDAWAALIEQQGAVRGFALTRDPSFENTYNRNRDLVAMNMALAREKVITPEVKQKLEVLAGEIAKWQASADKQLELARQPETLQEAVAMTMTTRLIDARSAAQAVTDQLDVNNDARVADLEGAVNFAQTLLVGGGIAAFLIAVGMGWMLSRGIVKPVLNMTRHMRRLLDGDMTLEVPCALRKDEFGQMGIAILKFRDNAIEKVRVETEAAAQREAAEAERARNEAEKARLAAEDQSVMSALGEGLSAMANGDLTHRYTASVPARAETLKLNFNAAMEQLQQAVSVVLTNVAGIRSGAGEISQAADDLSRRTEQQAASLEETAAALDEITATVNKTASGARQASSVVLAARGDAETSGTVVRDAVEAMSAIEKSAGQISQIIGVIDEIAFQTNLLALNAGVEAARAGDAGRGFAVVASEVRALAQRSAEAAKEIKALIQASTAQVGSGVTLVGQTGEALQRIVGRVAEIDSLVSEIAASAQEQATGLAQVNTAVNQMDQVTQQNAAMVEESTAASHSLAQEAEALAASVSRFHVGQVIEHSFAKAASRPPRSKPATSLKSTGRSAAVRKPVEVAADDRWEEF